MASEPDPLDDLPEVPFAPPLEADSGALPDILPLSLQSQQPLSPLDTGVPAPAFTAPAATAATTTATSEDSDLFHLAPPALPPMAFTPPAPNTVFVMESINLDDALESSKGHGPPSASNSASAAALGSPRADAAAAVAGTSNDTPSRLGRPAAAAMGGGASGCEGPHVRLVGDPLLGPVAVAEEELGSSQLPRDAVIKIWVKDPEKVEQHKLGVSIGTYWTYLVRSEIAPPPAATSPSRAPASPPPPPPPAAAHEARRRFNDFDALHKLLKAEYRGYFVPPLPDKAFFESTFGQDNFLKVRRVDLQAFMRAIAAHPVLGTSDALHLFLTSPAELSTCPGWQALLSQHRAATPAESIKGLFSGAGAGAGASAGGNYAQLQQQQLQHGGGAGGGGSPQAQLAAQQQHGGLGGSPLSGGAAPRGAPGGGGSTGPALMTRMRHTLMGVARPMGLAPPPPPLPDDEVSLRAAKDALRELAAQLAGGCATARALVAHMEGVCDELGALGRSCATMARWEEGVAQREGRYTPSGSAAVQRASDLQLMGYANLRQHNVWKQFALRTAASLVFLHDYATLLPEAVVALEEREAALEVVQLLAGELREKAGALEREGGGGGGAAHGGGGAIAAAAAGVAAAARERRVAALAAAVAQLQVRLRAARATYDTLKARNQSELARLNLERAADFRRALQNFARVQQQLAQSVADVWGTVLAQFQQRELDGAAL